MDKDDERNPILESNYSQNHIEESRYLKVYKRRWWVTFVFCYAGFTQAIVWNTWGPIAESLELVFGWTDANIAEITNMSSILFSILVLPFGSLMDAKGLRFTMLLCMLIIFICTLIRCFTFEPELFTPLAYISSFLQGFGGLACFSGTALFAAVWFPVKTRPNITALTSFFNFFGVTMGFIIQPQMVPDPVYLTVLSSNCSNSSIFTSPYEEHQYNGMNTTPIKCITAKEVANMDSMKEGIRYLMYLHAGLSGLALFLVLVYFPAKPPTPPSITASRARTSYKEVYREILTNAQLLVVVVAGALPRSVISIWIAIFDVVVKQLGVSQIDAGWIAFWHMLIGSAAGMVFTKFSDFLSSRRKGLVIVTTLIALGCCIWTALLCERRIDFNLVSLYVSCILLGFSVHGLMPLFYEMSAEAAYPIGEGAAGGFFTLMFNLIGIVYLAMLSVPGINVPVMTWICVGSIMVSLPLIVVYKERNKRYIIDTHI